MLPNKLYDWLKWIAILALPAAGLFYSKIAGIWGLPYATEIAGTIDAIGTLLGALLGISTYKYNKTNSK